MSEKPRNPKLHGLYVVTLNVREGNCIGKWDGKEWSLWCGIWDPPEWDPAYALNCAVVAWADPGAMHPEMFTVAKRAASPFSKKKGKP